jgi:glycosyltransferase involved in cell wall biosynthesis
MKIVAIGDARSTHLTRYIKYFVERGHEVHLITYDLPDELPEWMKARSASNLTFHVVGSDHLFLKFFFRDRKVRKIIRQVNPDVVHAHFVTKYGFHIRKGETPSLITAWGDDILVLPKMSRAIMGRTKKALEAADHIYAVSQNLKQHIAKDFDIEEDKISVNPGGVDIDVFNPDKFEYKADDPEDKEIVIFCNRGFNPVYDIPTLVKAFRLARMENPNITLYLAGSRQIGTGEPVKIMKGDGLFLLGQIKHENMPQYLAVADIFISTATSDGTPISLLEAMAMKKACIATAVGGVPEWIENGGNGILVPPGDEKEIARAILDLADDAKKRMFFGENARKTVELKGNFYKNMEEIEKGYKDMVFKKGQPQPWRMKKEAPVETPVKVEEPVKVKELVKVEKTIEPLKTEPVNPLPAIEPLPVIEPVVTPEKITLPVPDIKPVVTPQEMIPSSYSVEEKMGIEQVKAKVTEKEVDKTEYARFIQHKVTDQIQPPKELRNCWTTERLRSFLPRR